MQFRSTSVLALIFGGVGLVAILTVFRPLSPTAPALETIDLEPVLIAGEDMQSGLYGVDFSPGAEYLLEAYPEFAGLPPAQNGAKLTLNRGNDSSGTVWIWLYRDRQTADQLYGIFSEDRVEDRDNDGFVTIDSGDLAQVGERATYNSFKIASAILNLSTEVNTLTLQRCSAVVTIRMSGTDFATVTAYAQRLDTRLQRDVCDGRR
jgi:hypothetical protein